MTAQQYGLGRGLASLIPQNKTVPKNKTILDMAVESETMDANTPTQIIGGGSPFVGDAQNQNQAQDQKQDQAPNRDQAQNAAMPQENGVLEVAVDAIHANPHQPRRVFNEEKLQELAGSIREKGILQPLIVTQTNDGYELIAGERRLRAAKIVGLKRVPVIVREYEEQDKLEMAIIENIQRHDLNPIEEARAYKKLTDEFALSQEEVAKKMGKSRSGVANTLRLLALPIEIQKAIEEERIAEGHAKALLAVENPEKQRALFEFIIKNGLTVRQAEAQSREAGSVVRAHTRSAGAQDPQLKAVEDELNERLGTKVQVKKQGNGAQVCIDCYSREELINLVNKMR